MNLPLLQKYLKNQEKLSMKFSPSKSGHKIICRNVFQNSKILCYLTLADRPFKEYVAVQNERRTRRLVEQQTSEQNSSLIMNGVRNNGSLNIVSNMERALMEANDKKDERKLFCKQQVIKSSKVVS